MKLTKLTNKKDFFRRFWKNRDLHKLFFPQVSGFPSDAIKPLTIYDFFYFTFKVPGGIFTTRTKGKLDVQEGEPDFCFQISMHIPPKFL